ncbi:MAG: hypothetical protein JJU11_08530 [Candidatus Sumerlaeia bacterium]|nr:hypothetical protein [Candidatus Sumerlaeia bacterium]
MKHWVHLLTLILFLPSLVAAQPTLDLADETVRVVPSSTTGEVGERMSLRLEFRDNLEVEEMEVALPDDQRTLLRLGTPRRIDTGVFEIQFRPLSGGPNEFGPLNLKLGIEGRSTPLEIQAGLFSLDIALPEDVEIGDIRDYSPPQEMPFSYLLRNVVLGAAFIAGLGLLALAGFGVYLLMKRRREEALKVPPVPPIESALESVRRLKSLELYDSLGPERHYTELSMSLRRYIEGELGHHAVEMTEDEMVELIRGELSSINKADTLVELFRRSSMAKFARVTLDREVANEDVLTAEQFLVAEEARLRALEAERQQQARQDKKDREERAA